MTQNRPCSDSLPARAIHNGFSNTTGLIKAQLVNLKYERMRERPNEGNVVIHEGKEKQKKREINKDDVRKKERQKEEEMRKAKQKAVGEVCKERKEKSGKKKKEKNKEAKKERETSSCPYTLFRSPITLQVSSCDLGGF